MTANWVKESNIVWWVILCLDGFRFSKWLPSAIPHDSMFLKCGPFSHSVWLWMCLDGCSENQRQPYCHLLSCVATWKSNIRPGHWASFINHLGNLCKCFPRTSRTIPVRSTEGFFSNADFAHTMPNIHKVPKMFPAQLIYIHHDHSAP